MNLGAPTQMFFLLSLIIVVIGLLAYFGVLGAALLGYSFWIVVIGYLVLVAGCMMRGA